MNHKPPPKKPIIVTSSTHSNLLVFLLVALKLDQEVQEVQQSIFFISHEIQFFSEKILELEIKLAIHLALWKAQVL